MSAVCSGLCEVLQQSQLHKFRFDFFRLCGRQFCECASFTAVRKFHRRVAHLLSLRACLYWWELFLEELSSFFCTGYLNMDWGAMDGATKVFLNDCSWMTDSPRGKKRGANDCHVSIHISLASECNAKLKYSLSVWHIIQLGLWNSSYWKTDIWIHTDNSPFEMIQLVENNV